MASYGDHSALGIKSVTASASPIRNDGLPVRGLYVGTGGNVTVTMADGSTGQFVAVPSGFVLPIQCTHVTAMTASDVLALI